MAQTMARPGATPPVVHRRGGDRLPWPLKFYSTSVGKKWVMALTGIGLIGFVVAHLIGNLKVFLGKSGAGIYQIDEYGESLRTLLHPIMPNQVVLWIMRVGLMTMIAVHVHAAYSLTMMNHRARPVKYQSKRDYIAANYASRTMRVSGIIVGAYLLFHLADLTWGWANPDFKPGQVHHNLNATFDRPLVVALYVIANALLSLHLYHGTWSLFQSLGLNNPRYNPARRVVATGIAALIGVGNCLIPILIAAGVSN